MFGHLRKKSVELVPAALILTCFFFTFSIFSTNIARGIRKGQDLTSHGVGAGDGHIAKV